MIIDERTEFADAQTAIGNAATKQITDVIDLGQFPTLKDIGTGKSLFCVIQIDTGILAAAGAANVTFKLESDSTADLATSPTVHWTSGAIPKATLVAGYRFAFALPMEERYERYLGVTATPDTNNVTTGAFSAWLSLDQPPTPTLFLPDAQN